MSEISQPSNVSTMETAPLIRPPSMPGIVFLHELHENRGSIIVWGLGYSALLVIAVMIYPVLKQNNVILNLLAGFGVLNIFATNYGLDAESVVGFKGYIAFQGLAWGPLIFALYSIPRSQMLFLEEEKRGTLDLLLSTPISRWRLLTEKTCALLASLIGILFIVWLILLGATLTSPVADLTPYEVTTAVWHLFPISCVIAMGGLFVSTLVRQPSTANGIMGFVVLGSFFLRAFADSAQDTTLLQLKALSIFNYFSAITILSYGPQPLWDSILYAAAGILFILSLIAFQRRDLQP